MCCRAATVNVAVRLSPMHPAAAPGVANAHLSEVLDDRTSNPGRCAQDVRLHAYLRTGMLSLRQPTAHPRSPNFRGCRREEDCSGNGVNRLRETQTYLPRTARRFRTESCRSSEWIELPA